MQCGDVGVCVCMVQFKCVATLKPPSVLPDFFEESECC